MSGSRAGGPGGLRQAMSIMDLVLEESGVSEIDVLGRGRTIEATAARHVMAVLMRRHTVLSMGEIGALMHKQRTSVWSMVDSMGSSRSCRTRRARAARRLLERCEAAWVRRRDAMDAAAPVVDRRSRLSRARRGSPPLCPLCLCGEPLKG